MRNMLTALMLLGLLVCAACAGGVSTAPVSEADALAGLAGTEQQDELGSNALADSLAGLSTPRDISASIELDGSTRSYLLEMGGFYSVLRGEGAETIFPERYVRLQPKSEEQVAHDYALIERIRTADSMPGQINLELAWEGDSPEGDNGLYIGFADRQTNRWVWRGPIQHATDLADFSELGVDDSENNEFGELLAFVNFSTTPVVIKKIFFTSTNVHDTIGDEYLYYVTTNMDDFSQHLHRAPADALDQSEVIFSTDEFEAIGRMEVATISNEELLIFNRFVQSCQWQVWQMGIDGSNPRLRRELEQGNIQHSAFSKDMTKEYCITDDWSSNNQLLELDAATGELIAQYDLLARNVTNPLWYNEGGFDCRMLFSVPENSLSDQWGLVSYVHAAHVPDGRLFPVRNMVNGESIVDVFCFNWSQMDAWQREYLLYSYRESNEDRYRVVMWDSEGSWPKEHEFVSLEGYNLRNPQMSPDQMQFSVIASDWDGNRGMLYVMPAFVRTIDAEYAVADMVSSTMWYDPTPPVWN